MLAQSASGGVPSIPDECFNRSKSSDFNPAFVNPEIPRTLDELWDLLDESQQADDFYSIDDACFRSEQEESNFWTRFDFESADDGEPKPP